MAEPHPQLLVSGGLGDGVIRLKDSWVVEVNMVDCTARCTKVSAFLLHPDTRPGTGIFSGRPSYVCTLHACMPIIHLTIVE